MTHALMNEILPPAGERPLRAMWLLNHSAARRFEIPMLKRMGIDEIFLPKSFPSDPTFRSASIDWSEDANLSIPTHDLALLNSIDWYSGGTREGWEVANRHFDVVFFIVHTHHLLEQIAYRFEGIALWRAYGLQKSSSYDLLVNQFRDGRLRHAIDTLGSRFYFAEAYPHLADDEPEYLKSRRLCLPLGIAQDGKLSAWEGHLKQIMFVCPDIALNTYYSGIYDAFKRDFGDLPHIIGGAQPLIVDDDTVLGFVTAEQHTHNMTQSRVMFYHGTEPNHVHYHPFEAIQTGMPLLFMAGGLLDKLGGVDLPGRCRSIGEARRKLQQVLGGNQRLIDNLCSTQKKLLDPMKAESCLPHWKSGFITIRSRLAALKLEKTSRPMVPRKKRVAVCLPIGYQGGTLRGARMLAHAIWLGSCHAGEEAEVVMLYPADGDYTPESWKRLPQQIRRRVFSWRILDASEATRAMHYAGFTGWQPYAERFIIPDDGINQLQDCDLWVFVSDRLSLPLLPLRPYILMVYDYLQRYEAVMPPDHDRSFLDAARRAKQVWVTTLFTKNDALQYAGIKPQNVRKLPMLASEITRPNSSTSTDRYFLWPTNIGVHKNHGCATQALKIYYEELGGVWDCWITGISRNDLLSSELPQLVIMKEAFKTSRHLRNRVKWKGNLSDSGYRQTLAGAKFLWLPTRIDNGSFSAVEAAASGVPSMCANYPAMREMNCNFNLGLTWMNVDDPDQMARQLKSMETQAAALRHQLRDSDCLAGNRLDDLASPYWQEIRECL